jgi:hypothetical protein
MTRAFNLSGRLGTERAVLPARVSAAEAWRVRRRQSLDLPRDHRQAQSHQRDALRPGRHAPKHTRSTSLVGQNCLCEHRSHKMLGPFCEAEANSAAPLTFQLGAHRVAVACEGYTRSWPQVSVCLGTRCATLRLRRCHERQVERSVPLGVGYRVRSCLSGHFAGSRVSIAHTKLSAMHFAVHHLTGIRGMSERGKQGAPSCEMTQKQLPLIGAAQVWTISRSPREPQLAGSQSAAR